MQLAEGVEAERKKLRALAFKEVSATLTMHVGTEQGLKVVEYWWLHGVATVVSSPPKFKLWG